MAKPWIEWVNHSCFIYDDGEARLISDPWLEGYAFDQGWALLNATRMGYERFHEVTHLWLSHEHPDHFSPQCLEKIPPEAARNITFMFQKTLDKRVVNFCRRYNFKQYIELDAERWVAISARTKVRCIPCRSDTNDDSMLFFKTDDTTVLNLNDCYFPTRAQAEAVQREAGKVDLLLAQFSYAGWAGNPEEQAFRKHVADVNMKKFIEYVNLFEPTHAVPTASMVYFCNEENAHMNDSSNTVMLAHEEILRQTKAQPVVLYPGDRWQLAAAHDPAAALAKYRHDYTSAPIRIPLVNNPRRSVAELTALATAFLEKQRRQNNRLFLALLPAAKIYLRDHKAAYRFSRRGLQPINTPPQQCDVIVGSAGLAYAFTHLWGGDTLNINGRFEKTAQGKFWHFRIYFAIAALNSVDRHFDWGFVFGNLRVVVAKAFSYLRNR